MGQVTKQGFLQCNGVQLNGANVCRSADLPVLRQAVFLMLLVLLAPPCPA